MWADGKEPIRIRTNNQEQARQDMIKLRKAIKHNTELGFKQLYEEHGISKSDVNEIFKDDMVYKAKKLGQSQVRIQKTLDIFKRKFEYEQENEDKFTV